MSIKLCCFCKRFTMDMSTDGYSELTPGSDAIICCEGSFDGKYNGWSMENGDTIEKYRENIRKAKTCPEYSPVDECTK